MTDRRPDPDALLERARAEDARGRRGSLKIFFGYAAGVGKTYAMLEAARRVAASGREVVAGYVEPHGRQETESLLEGLEILPLREVTYRGVALREFDLDAALARRPDLILVDELAHTNAEGSRHAKRWQDVEELLGSGIDAWTTLNVQHIDSLNDSISRITGVRVRETLPDRVFDQADELELIDLAPDELLGRLNAGKIYGTDRAQRALGGFFQRSNLVALREFSLRQAARRVQTDVESARRERSISEPWPTAERLLVCVGPGRSADRMIRTAKRMAVALDAPWLAVSVDRAGRTPPPAVRERIAGHFRLAERLGAETVTLSGEDVAATLLDYARSRNVTKILIGKTAEPRWRRILFGTIVDAVLDRSGDIDVYVMRGEGGHPQVAAPPRHRPPAPRKPYLKAGAVLAVGGLVAALIDRLGLTEANVVMALLAAVVVVATRYGRGPAVVASVVAVLGFDFCFVTPRLSFAVTDGGYLITFGVMLTTALTISTLTARLKVQLEAGRVRERRISALYDLGRQLSALSGGVFLAAAAGRKILDLCGGEVTIYLGQPGGPADPAFGRRSSIASHPVSEPTARWVIDHDQLAGAGTDTLPNAVALFVPLTASHGTVGALAVRTDPIDLLLEPEGRRLLEACAGQLALALERDRLAMAASEALASAHAEQVRSALLSSVSHDLRTPLAVIAGSGSSLLRGDTFDESTRRQLLETIVEESSRLGRLLENLLQMSKLEMDGATVSKQWNLVEEVVGSALGRVRDDLRRREVAVRMPVDLPMVFVDGLLLEQLFVNLFENAARYTPPATPITVSAQRDGAWVAIVVADAGPGLTPGDEERIFEKFYRGTSTPDATRGSGLGLAICRAIAGAHGGTIRASNRPGGGVEFVLRLPLADEPPIVQL